MLIGGGGKRVLSIAAREADIVGINGDDGRRRDRARRPRHDDRRRGGRARWRSCARRAGDRIDDIELNIRVFIVSVTDDRAGDIAGVASMIGVDPVVVERSPFALIGTHGGDRRRPASAAATSSASAT